MALKLPRFQAGRPLTEEVTADKLNQLVDAIRQCELNSGVGYDVARGPGGTTLTVKPGVMASAAPGATVILGMTNSGMSHTDATVVNPGISSYNFECRTPTGGYTTAYVHGSYSGQKIRFNTNSALGAITIETKFEAHVTGVFTNPDDNYRSVGLLVSHQGEVFESFQNNTTGYASSCDAFSSGNYVSVGGGLGNKIITCNHLNDFEGSSGTRTGSLYGTTSSGGTLCSGVRYIVTATCSGVAASYYYTFTSVGVTAAAGSFVTDNIFGAITDAYVGTDSYVPGGVYFYKRTFEIPDNVSPSTVRIKLRLRLKSSGDGKSTINSVRINGANVSYTYFETSSSTIQPIEIAEGFQSGTNTLEIGVYANNFDSYPTVSFEFLPTTSTIISINGSDTGSFPDLTAAQQDLIGQGTPVKVKVTGVDKIYTYNGTGSKTSSGSYTYLRDA